MSRVFDNLLINAIKFSPDGGTVTVRILEEPGQVNVYVYDMGIGIPADKLDRLFDRFYRASDSEDKPIAGTGLGLSIVKAIIEAHAGIDRGVANRERAQLLQACLQVLSEAGHSHSANDRVRAHP